MSGNSRLIPIMNSLEAKPSFLSREADHVPSHLGSLRDPNCTMPEERSEDLVNNLAHFLRQNENATPVDLNTEQHGSDELKSTRIGKTFASPRFNPVGNLINERPTVSGCESSRNKGHSKKLDGQGPFFEAKKVLNIVLSIFIHPSTEKWVFVRICGESRKGIKTLWADLIGDLLGRITGDHQQNKGESNPA